MNNWQRLLAQSITNVRDLPPAWGLDVRALSVVTDRYPMRINPYYLSLIRTPYDPIFRQAVPDEQEINDQFCIDDPLAEENLSPVPNLVHKYPDRALFLVASTCAMYCRFCTRKRKVATSRFSVTPDTIRAGLDYLKRTPAIRDVLLSGGDPLLLDDEAIKTLLESLRRIPSIEIIRIGSRVPCTLPMRVTSRLARMLKKFHPLYINTHFNHPDELTPQACLALQRLINAGIPLGCQTVLLRGVNDDSLIMKKLLHKLLLNRVKPYYIFQGDLTKGTNHFRTPVATGLAIIEALAENASGLALPTYAIDLPGGGGKVPILPKFASPCHGYGIRMT
jgi:lysine 2,3-aminomutase